MRYLYFGLYIGIAYLYLLFMNLIYVIWTFNFKFIFTYQDEILHIEYIRDTTQMDDEDLPWFAKPIRWMDYTK